MPHGGRLPVLATPAIVSSIIERVRQGAPLGTAARLSGVTPAAISLWRQIANGATTWPSTNSPISAEMREMVRNFFEEVAQAEAEAAMIAVETIRSGMSWVNLKTGEPGWRAGAWYLNNSPSTRDDWHEMRESHTEVSGTIRLQPVIRQLDTSDLEALALPPPPTPPQDDTPDSDA